MPAKQSSWSKSSERRQYSELYDKSAEDFAVDSIPTLESGRRLKYHPLSLWALGIWMGYIAVMIWFLNDLSLSSPDPDLADRYNWRDQAATIMLIVFAQAHVSITATHLSRLAISALQKSSTSPRTWVELFWVADRNWEGPFTMGKTFIEICRLRIRPSFTFFLFSLACVLALITPVTISRAWPVQTTNVTLPASLSSDAFSPSLLNVVDSSSQMSIGAGGWATGQSVAGIYNDSTYFPKNAKQSIDPSSGGQLFFSGDVHGMDVQDMQGVWVNGSCEVVPSLPQMNYTTFVDWGAANGWSAWSNSSSTTYPASNITLNLWWCSNWTANYEYNPYWMNNVTNSSASVMFYVNGTDTKSTTEGYIRCDSSFQTGIADINGQNKTFDRIDQRPWYNTSVKHNDIPLHPLIASIITLSLPFGQETDPTDLDSWADTERVDSLVRMLGYGANFDDASGKVIYEQANISTIASQLWSGTVHMSAAIGLVSRERVNLRAVQHSLVSRRVQKQPFIILTLALLGGWLLVLVYCTLRMFRPTFGGSLNSYSAARLLADHPELMYGHCCGDLDDNRNLLERFDRVADTEPNEQVGHIGVLMHGVGGTLSSKRLYKGAAKKRNHDLHARLLHRARSHRRPV